jgi:diguanylate cyclase (GGDEF)-like protein/PAS domain S-box-containing protein
MNGTGKKQIILEIEKLKKVIDDIKYSEGRYEILKKSLDASEIKYNSLLDSIPSGIIEMDRNGIIVNINKSALRILDCKKEEIIKKHFGSVNAISKNNLPQYFRLFDYEANSKEKSGDEIVFEDRNGNKMFIEARSSLIKNGVKVTGIHIIIENITESKKIENELKYLKFHDQLTGLFNRYYIDEEIKRLDAERHLPVGFIISDVNGLKLINDAFGNDEGDRLLQNIAGVFRKACRKEDIIARYGEDEFAVILHDTDRESLSDINEKILKLCGYIKKEKFDFTISTGIAAKENAVATFSDVITEARDMMYKNKLVCGKSMQGNAVISMVDSLLGEGYETREHVKRVEKMSKDFGTFLKLPKSKIDELSILASLHDLGKVAIPDKILKEKEKLSKEDWDIIKSFPEIGYDIAKSSFKFSHIADYILCHHERWDGSGYPGGIKGNEIPLLSRILSIIDSYDVMRSGRFYKKPLSKSEAIRELRKCSGKQFDPVLLEQFISLIE